MIKRPVLSAIVVSLLFSVTVHRASAATIEVSLATRCEALASIDFSTIQDAPTQVTATRSVAAKGNVPAHCQVEGYVWPQVGFRLGLPTTWNGKFYEVGCGGDCGSTGYFEVPRACGTPLQRGYACIAFSGGHIGSGGLWAANNLQGQVDFAYRGAHVTALSGKAIIERYYSEPPKYSYFCGCSTGGRMALIEAQRFPWDFDGIISGAPWINDTDSAMNFVWANRALKGRDGKPIVNRADLKLVHEAVLAHCDMDDGVTDGLIGNPLACQFDPHELVCKAGKNPGCLTKEQADAVQKVYDGPSNSKGEKTYVSGAAVGSEMGWVDDALDYIRSDGRPGGAESWALDFFRYMVMPAAGPNWQLANFDFDRDYKRFGAGTQESLLNASNPDLRKFKAAGGKLLIYQGWNDQSDLPQMTIDYYATVSKTMGGSTNTEEFARLFVIPGMLHCTGGDGAFAIDYLTYLEHWVEHGQPPDKLIGSHVDDTYLARLGGKPIAADASDIGAYDGPAKFTGALMLKVPPDAGVPVTFTRPIYPYPILAKYKGAGDPKDAANFVATEP